MNLVPIWNWLKKLWTVEKLDLSEWLKEGFTPFGRYREGMKWTE